ncbi:lytic transglycosylase [Aurantimonas sp. Leaf443]|nr:lytic transglycosylase [Aurantimonas sp. Leaf443]
MPAGARRTLLGTLALTLAATSVQGQDFALPVTGPTPAARPFLEDAGVAIDPGRFGAPAAAPNPVLRPAAAATTPASATAFTASIAAMSARSSSVKPMRGELKDGLQALSEGNVIKARAIREGMMPGSLDRQILTYAVAQQGGRDVPAGEIAGAASELRGWPGLKTLRANSEKAIWREQRPAREVLQLFAGGAPASPEGAMALARAHIETGDARRARAVIARVWREERLDKDLEERILSQFQTLLTQADHRARMDKLLYGERITDAGRMAGRAGAKQVYAAVAAAIRGDAIAPKLLAAVPAAQRNDPIVVLARVEILRKKGDIDGAAQLLIASPRDPAVLIDPDAWWNERRIVARDLLDAGKARLAYRVAANHSAENSPEAAEAEFHAGWFALRFLNEPRAAAQHFAKIAQMSNKPLSLSRSYYWQGRAAEAGAGGNAAAFYAKAASYSATFYGQVAAARLGRRPEPIVFPKASAAERDRFAQREPVRAIQRLQQVGSQWRADALMKAMADELDSPGELGLLSALAERNGDHPLVLQIGKQAYWRGIDAPALAFPTGVIPANANISAAGKALAYAIARQESAFNPKARSPVGALGLLQLMPGTAKSMAAKAGLPYSPARLTSDTAYNATLGSHFLGEQIDNFDGSYVLTFAAYNAGPRRAREWIQRFGDPRGKSMEEVVDWVERIPFTETRNYVQRVMENYEVYKNRLGAPVNVEQDLRFGRRG